MDSDYKVLIRDYFGPDSGFLRWEEGCPLVPAAVQVSLKFSTGKQARSIFSCAFATSLEKWLTNLPGEPR